MSKAVVFKLSNDLYCVEGDSPLPYVYRTLFMAQLCARIINKCGGILGRRSDNEQEQNENNKLTKIKGGV
jgi:hypothetical protein